MSNTYKNSLTTQIVTRIPHVDVAYLDSYCDTSGLTRSDVVRGLLQAWIDGKRANEAAPLARVEPP